MEKSKHPKEPNILKAFAQILRTEVKNRRLEIPQEFGSGYCSGFVFNEHIRMLIMNYELKEDFDIKNPDFNQSVRMILFKFKNVIPKAGTSSSLKQLKPIPSVLIATSTLNTDLIIPIHTNTSSINIEVDADYLSGLFDLSERYPVLHSLLQNTQPLLFEQMIFPYLQKIVDEIISESVDQIFEPFFLRVKAEELICRLLMELKKRDEKHLYNLNIRDIEAIYKVKGQMLERLETPPVIKELAVSASMSPSKLKYLFKQIFGKSIFSYYQEFRMQEAALLLKTEKLSVSDVGYQLGFTNLSHFSRVFNEHIGMKPKQYSRS
jgi:AraC-like DNA-binding protein